MNLVLNSDFVTKYSQGNFQSLETKWRNLLCNQLNVLARPSFCLEVWSVIYERRTESDASSRLIRILVNVIIKQTCFSVKPIWHFWSKLLLHIPHTCILVQAFQGTDQNQILFHIQSGLSFPNEICKIFVIWKRWI